MTTRSFSDLIANEDTNLTATAVGDYLLIYDASEPLDINKIKVVSIANLMKLTTETARQPMVTGQAAGDMFYASGGTAISRLAKGTSGQVLKMNSGATAPEWGDAGAYAVVAQNSSVSQIMGSPSYIPFTSEAIDDDTMHDNSTNNSRLTCKKTGRYFVLFNCTAEWESNTTTLVSSIKKNRTTDLRLAYTPYNAESQSIYLVTYIDLELNDYIEIAMTESGTGGITINLTRLEFSMVLDA